MNLSDHLAERLRRHGLVETAGVVAVSGGPDSVALSHVCVELLREGKLPRLVLAHVNHMLRADESDADERFVQQLPALWQMANDARLQCRTTRIDVAGIAEAEGGNLESIGRRERYAWLARLACEEGAAWIATGHTADDQAETVLFRLLRGSGVLGLGGMTERRPLLLSPSGRGAGGEGRTFNNRDRTPSPPAPLPEGEGRKTTTAGVSLIRPLLTIRRQAMLDYLRDKQIPYRIDSSNRDLRFTRNRLRHELLPMLETQFNRGVVDVLCRLADQAQELSGEIAAQAETLRAKAELPNAGSTLVFAIATLKIASPNLIREMLRLVWQREGWPMGDMDFERWHWLVEIVQGLHQPAIFLETSTSGASAASFNSLRHLPLTRNCHRNNRHNRTHIIQIPQASQLCN